MAKRKAHKTIYHKHKRKKFSKKQREFVFIRDNFACNLCKKDLKDLPEERVLDHKIPLCQGGSNEMCNIWLLCHKCDKKKSKSILQESVTDRLNYLKTKYKYLNK